ncbi:MAG: FAD-dependent protein, partial [Ferruginibacter sp.]
FSFCMCPGGIIAPAATAPGELVVNGWSPSKRNNPFANSGIVVPVSLEAAMQATKDLHLEENDPLVFMHYQQITERLCYAAGGGNFVAPAQRMQDFTTKKLSATLPANSYLPGLTSVQLKDVLPFFIYDALAKGLKLFGKKMKGFYTNEAVVVATESRTSSPVRIPRHPETLMHPHVQGLYPCGEGAGYAGGIVSAAMDGENVANAIKASFN